MYGPTWTLHGLDALTTLLNLPDESVDAVITDPPYNSSGTAGGSAKKGTGRSKYVSSNARHRLPDFDGENRDQHGYLAWMTMILTQCHRITVRGGTLLIFTDWRQLPTTSDALQAAGWSWRGIVPWHKPTVRPFRGGPKNACEYVLWASRGPVNADRNPVYLPGLHSHSQPRGAARVHITQKPLELMAELVKICPPGGTVLDPFTGSGSTGVAALESGRSFVGTEQSEEIRGTALDRLRAVEDAVEIVAPRPATTGWGVPHVEDTAA